MSARAAAAAIAALGVCGCSSSAAPAPGEELVLLREAKLDKLAGRQGTRFEGSGVTLHDGSLWVAFDDMTSLAVVDPALTTARLTPGDVVDSQFEGIGFDGAGSPWVVVELDATSRAALVRVDPATGARVTEATDLVFDGKKGVEGIAWVGSGGKEVVLALCEANLCREAVTERGQGRVRVLSRGAQGWATTTTLSVPALADFADYADLAVRDRGDGSWDVAVVSQESSALWVGRLTASPWAFDGPGRVFHFPRKNGDIRYCDVEGVTFLDAGTLAFVSDKSSREGCGDKEQSIHVFAIPE